MKKSNTWVTGLLLSALLSLQPFAHGESQDTRTVIKLDPAARTLVLVEMRDFLGNVQLISEALSQDDLKTVAKAARAVGMHAAHEVPDAVKAQLPKEFKQLGFGVHKEFDQLALDAETLGDAKHSMKQLSAILQKCVACHATYQLVSVAAQ